MRFGRRNYFLTPEAAKERPRLAVAVAQFRELLVREAVERNAGDLRAAAGDLGIGFSTIKTHLHGERERAAAQPPSTYWFESAAKDL